MTPLVLALPWVAVLAYVFLWARLPRELPGAGVDSSDAPLVSVIVPARNEAENIETCVASLIASRYPTFEVIVVDDRSEDSTGSLARALGRGAARRALVLKGRPVPPGWLGKPWACWQGYGEARGEVLLFTDADTRHGPDLLGRAVSALAEEEADLLTIVGTQLMETFWERLVQPQVFLTMLVRFPRFEQAARSPRWRDAIANGQFILMRRHAYEAIGGHEAVHDEVVEDLALAQLVKRSGLSLRIRSAEADLETRMYRSLRGLVEGWSKNIVMGGLQSVPAWMRPVVSPLALLAGVGLWLLPPVALIASLTGFGGSALLAWSGTVCLLSAGHWMAFTRRLRAPAWHGLLYPLGAAVGVYIFLRSWAGGRRVTWKGRRYELPPVSGRR